jgi:hypothetical protein
MAIVSKVSRVVLQNELIAALSSVQDTSSLTTVLREEEINGVLDIGNVRPDGLKIVEVIKQVGVSRLAGSPLPGKGPKVG